LRNEVLATFSCLGLVMTANQEFVVASEPHSNLSVNLTGTKFGQSSRCSVPIPLPILLA